MTLAETLIAAVAAAIASPALSAGILFEVVAGAGGASGTRKAEKTGLGFLKRRVCWQWWVCVCVCSPRYRLGVCRK